MKKVFFLLLFLAVQTVVFAQEGRQYVPFVEEGKSWYCSCLLSNETSLVTPEDPLGMGIDCIFTMQGDTEINGKSYKKVYCQYQKYYGDEELHYYCAVREENYRVYMVEDETTEEVLIYDFSCPGELITLPFTYNDYKFARTRGGRRHDFQPGQLEYLVCNISGDEMDYSHAGSWIDGVGDYMHNPFALEFSNLIYDEPKLGKEMCIVTCMKDGNYIFDINWLSEPCEPTSIESSNHVNSFQKNSLLYDLQGRQLNSQPGKGVFIQNGKKVMVK
jgi:hypothetical protein